MEIGEEAVIAEASRFGHRGTPVLAVPSIHLGSADVVKPLELIAAYTAFANQGERADADGRSSASRTGRATSSGSPSPASSRSWIRPSPGS